MRMSWLVAGLALLGLVGCSAQGTTGGFGNGGTGGNGGSAGNGGGNVTGNGNGGSPAGGKVLLYAHTDTTLYELDPENITAPMQKLGDFDCIGGSSSGGGASAMTDLGVDLNGQLYGVSEGAAYPLTASGGHVHCAQTWQLPSTRFYGLTIAPAGTVAAEEVLIGADGQGGLYQIDQSSGTPTQVGTLGSDPQSGLPWSLSGDIVFLANGGNPIGFATVRTCSGSSSSSCDTVDTLVEVNVAAIHPGTQSVLQSVRGQVMKGSWCQNAGSPDTFGSMFGIAAYQDKVYGFSRKGDIVEIHNVDGSACAVGQNTGLKFAGAGVTTNAPVIAPPK